MGVLAAGFTSFYMWRLVFMTFFSGATRAPEPVASHVHESPLSMTLPLMILGLLSLIGGALGWPHLWAGHDWIAGWLAPVVGAGTGVEGEHVGLEWRLMGTATAVGVAGFALAYFLYAKRLHPMATRMASQRPWRWLYVRVYEKWHVDELYETVCIRPITWLSKVVLYEGVDRRIIDALVNFVGWIGRTLGAIGQLFHSGNIQRYLAIFAIGLAIILYGWLSPAKPHNPPPSEAPAAAQMEGNR